MKETFLKVLSFLNLLDRTGNVSITNTAVITLITKIAIAPLDWPTAAGLLVALINYGHKRMQSSQAEQAVIVPAAELQEKVEQVEQTLSALSLKVGLKR